MRLNADTKLCGCKVILVPYEAHHVPKYHNWMSNSELRLLTASERLSLDEEYEMQKSWSEDSNKLTFIVLSAKLYARENNEIDAMIGDGNLFFRYDDETGENIAEAEIMIAEESARGQGYGREAMLLLFKYVQTQSQLNLHKYEVKIDIANTVSIRLFESLQFQVIRRVEVFHEIVLERSITSEWVRWLNTQVQYELKSYSSD